MMVKHTPGPWREDGYGMIWVDDSTDRPIAQVRGWGWLQKTESPVATQDANARLIAAAPKLLEALKAVVGWIETSAEGEEATKVALAAIAKAEGDE